MQRLEDVIGQPILRRSGSGVRLTTGGETLLAHADALLAKHDKILAEMCGTELRGSLNLGYRPPAPEVFVPAMTAWPAALTRPVPPAKLPVVHRPTLHEFST